MLLLGIVQGIVLIVIGPLVLGTLRWASARLQRRQGPSPLQTYRDLFKLLSKEPVIPSTASWVFLYAPVAVFACYAAPGFLAPVFYLPKSGMASQDDLITLIAILALARLALGLAGMEPGSPFGGLGSSRELFLHILTEPTLIFVAFVLALTETTTSLTVIMNHNVQAPPWKVFASPSWLLLGLALALVSLLEAGRLPIDNPDSHLELTMFGKAIHIEYAGSHLALLEWAEALRLTFLLTLLLNLFLPWSLAAPGRPLWVNALLILFYPLRLFLALMVLAIWEALQTKMRLRAIVTPALTAAAIAVIAVILASASRGLL